MNAVHAALLYAVRPFLLTETRGIAGQGLRQLLLREDGVNKFANHGMFACPNQVQIFSFYFIHHGVHLRKAHDPGHDITADHKWRHAVSKAPAYHKIPGIGNHCGMKPRDVSHQVIKAVSGYLPRAVQIEALETLHNLCMVGNLKIRRHRLAIFLHLHVLAVIFANRHGRVDDIRNCHHDFRDFLLQLSFHLLKLGQTLSSCIDFGLYFLCLFLLALSHQGANLLGKLLAVGAERIGFLLGLPRLCVQLDDLIHQRQLAVLELIADILFHHIRVFP